MNIRPAAESDKPSWLAMRQALWPHASLEEHMRDIERYLSSPDKWIGIAANLEGDLTGFIEVSTSRSGGCQKSSQAFECMRDLGLLKPVGMFIS